LKTGFLFHLIKYNSKMYFNNRICLTHDSEGKLVDENNVILFEGEKYYVLPLNSSYLLSKGGNSSVYRLTDNKSTEYAIKFSNYPRPNKKGDKSKGYSRFIYEISALKLAAENEFQNVIKFISEDSIQLEGKEYPYIIMEKADTDLKEYLLNDPAIDIQQKFLLCKDIFKAIKDLHSLYIYHRDIKPDNILLFIAENKFSWKIADLGLAKHRDMDFDDIGEKVGPFGWFSPEAMNKFLTEKSNLGLDCIIDEHSDIFMLGELFWFVFKLNIPLGQIKIEDFNIDFPESKTYFELVQSMLSHSKKDRITLDGIEFFLDNIGKELFV